MTAAANGHLDCVNVLLANGARVDSANWVILCSMPLVPALFSRSFACSSRSTWLLPRDFDRAAPHNGFDDGGWERKERRVHAID